jgi:thioredoxin-dependent peroxiredoxin
VLGASFDTPEDNNAFAEKEHFDFRLLSDVDRKVGTAYEVLRPADAPYPDFPLRVAYLIDPDGVIRQAYEVQDVAGFAGAVLDDLDALEASPGTA